MGAKARVWGESGLFCGSGATRPRSTMSSRRPGSRRTAFSAGPSLGAEGELLVIATSTSSEGDDLISDMAPTIMRGNHRS